jgi:phage terminase large subunit-like protein
MEKVNTLNLTQKQKDQLLRLLEITQDKKIQKFISRKQHKRQNNEKTYETRKSDAIFCQCCNKTVDKYYITKHNETKTHIANLKKEFCETNV